MASYYQNALLILIIALNSSTVFVSSNSGSGNVTGDLSTLYDTLTADPASTDTIPVTSMDSLESSIGIPSTPVGHTDMTTTMLMSTNNDEQPTMTPTSRVFTTNSIDPNKSSSSSSSTIPLTNVLSTSSTSLTHAATATETTMLFSTSTKMTPSGTMVRSSSISSTRVISTMKIFHPTSTTHKSTTRSALGTSTTITSPKSTQPVITTFSVSFLPIPSNYFTTTTTTRAVPHRRTNTTPELTSGALTGIVIGGLLVLLFLTLIIVSVVKYFIAERKKNTNWNELRPLRDNENEQDNKENVYKLLQ